MYIYVLSRNKIIDVSFFLIYIFKIKTTQELLEKLLYAFIIQA